MTGLKVGEDGVIKRWEGVYCQAPGEIAQGGTRTGRFVGMSGAAGRGGRDVEFHCPAGSYIQSMRTEHDDGIKKITPTCASLRTGEKTAEGAIGTRTGSMPPGDFPCGAYSGVGTTANDNLKQVRVECTGDAARVRANYYTAEGRARCCMGLEGECLARPQSGECDRFMATEFCPANPAHPFCTCLRSPVPCPNKFDGRCITNNGYRTQDMLAAPCPDAITCQQFVTFGPEARAVATRVEQNCPNASPANTQRLPERPLPENSAMAGSWGWLWLLLLVVLLLTVLVAGALLWEGQKGETEAEGPGAGDVPVREPSQV
jgi:hypothetical protein